MATILDSLLIQIGFDVKGLNSNVNAVTKKLEEVERAAESFLALIGGTVAIKHFVLDVIDTNAALDRLSKNLNLGVSTISAWGNAAEQVGGSAQGVQGSLDLISKAQTELQLTGQSALIPYLSALGVSLADITGKARPADQVLLDLAARFEHLPRQEANNLGRMIGLDQGTLNLLLQGRREVELQIARGKEHNAVTKEQAQEATRLKQRIVDLGQGFQALGRDLLQQASPAIEKVLDVLQAFGKWAIQNKEFIVDFLKVMAVGLGAIGLATLPIDGLVIAIIALGAGIALLWQDYQTWKRGGDSFIDWNKWKPGIEHAEQAFERLSALLKDLWGWMEKVQGSPLGRWFSKLGEDSKAAYNNAIRGGRKDAFGEQGVQMEGGRANDPKAIKQWFIDHGWSPAQAAGITANIISESGGNVNAVGDRGQAFGLAQWHPDRQAAFKELFGRDIRGSTMEQQLAFIQYELTQGSRKSVGDQLKGVLTAADAGALVSRRYEAPKDANGEAARRAALAQTLLGIPGAAGVAASSIPAGAGGSTSIDKSLTTGDITIQTQATDAAGIASSFKDALNYLFTSQANTGLN